MWGGAAEFDETGEFGVGGKWGGEDSGGAGPANGDRGAGGVPVLFEGIAQFCGKAVPQFDWFGGGNGHQANFEPVCAGERVEVELIQQEAGEFDEWDWREFGGVPDIVGELFGVTDVDAGIAGGCKEDIGGNGGALPTGAGWKECLP